MELDRAWFEISNFFWFFSLRTTPIARVSQSKGSIVNAETSSRVGPNSSQAAMEVWLSILPAKQETLSLHVSYIEIVQSKFKAFLKLTVIYILNASELDIIFFTYSLKD